jgi:hypothetical protein
VKAGGDIGDGLFLRRNLHGLLDCVGGFRIAGKHDGFAIGLDQAGTIQIARRVER